MLPDFLVIGAARCATTSLHYYLAQHPDIGMSAIKEPNFFLFEQTPSGPRPLIGEDRRMLAKSVADRERYERLFPAGVTLCGEVSPLYLYVRETPQLIADLVPDARLVAVLREPVARAYSHFIYLNGHLGADVGRAFAAAVREEITLPYTPYRSGTHVLRLGRYGEQVERYQNRFAADQLLVLRYEDVVADPSAALAAICRHIGATDHRFDTSVRYNPGATRRSLVTAVDTVIRPALPYLKRALPAGVTGRLAQRRHALRAAASGHVAVPALDPATAELLTDYYADDLARLAQLTGVTFG